MAEALSVLLDGSRLGEVPHRRIANRVKRAVARSKQGCQAQLIAHAKLACRRQIKNENDMALALVVAMIRELMSRCGIMEMGRCGIIDRMRSRCAASRRNGLRASQMQRRLAGYFRAETETQPAVSAPLLRHRSQRVALAMIAGSTTWPAGHSRGWNSDDAHSLILEVCSAAIASSQLSYRCAYYNPLRLVASLRRIAQACHKRFRFF